MKCRAFDVLSQQVDQATLRQARGPEIAQRRLVGGQKRQPLRVVGALFHDGAQLGHKRLAFGLRLHPSRTVTWASASAWAGRVARASSISAMRVASGRSGYPGAPIWK
jgi:hypothetical protein